MGDLLTSGGGGSDENSIGQDASLTVGAVVSRNVGLKGKKNITFLSMSLAKSAIILVINSFSHIAFLFFIFFSWGISITSKSYII